MKKSPKMKPVKAWALVDEDGHPDICASLVLARAGKKLRLKLLGKTARVVRIETREIKP